MKTEIEGSGMKARAEEEETKQERAGDESAETSDSLRRAGQLVEVCRKERRKKLYVRTH